MGPLQAGREHSSTRPEQTAQNGGMRGRTLVTFASHPSEFVSCSVDPPPPTTGLVMGVGGAVSDGLSEVPPGPRWSTGLDSTSEGFQH